MIKLIVLDIDGCMTNGKIIYTNSGDELKEFNVKDGFAIKEWMRFKKDVAIITGRESKIVENRAKELGIGHLYQGVKDKFNILVKLKEELNLEFENIAAIGDDLNDFRLLKSVGISFAPKDAIEYIKESVDILLSKNGGDGAIREMIEYLLKKDGLYNKYLDFWTKAKD